MYGMPCSSRSTRTGALRPGSASSPSTLGPRRLPMKALAGSAAVSTPTVHAATKEHLKRFRKIVSSCLGPDLARRAIGATPRLQRLGSIRNLAPVERCAYTAIASGDSASASDTVRV